MGSTDEASKLRDAKKKVDFGSEEIDPSTKTSSPKDAIMDPLENGLEDMDKIESKSSSSEAESDEDGACKPKETCSINKGPPKTPSLDIAHGARPRYDSESSSEGGKSPSTDRMKRRRTVSESSPVQSFIFPGVAASPPKFMSLEEVMKAAKGVSNMVLAHEIAVDKNFKLEKFDPPENSVERQVRDVMHKAFWDNLEEELSQESPSYEQAFVLLQEVRDNLMDITLPRHTRLRQEINERLDIDLIKQQAQHNVLDFRQYSQCVLSIMARLCAPVRDDTIQNLGNETDVVTVFRGVMETLDLMRLDMANFTIQQIRPHIIAQSVDYEKKKFEEFLKTQNDGLELTRTWLVKHIAEEDFSITDPFALRVVVNKIIAKAYLELLKWSDDDLLPETVVLDGSRILELRDRLMQVCMLASTMLVTLSSLGPLIQQPDTFKIKLKRDLCSILDPALSEKETLDSMENIAEQVAKDVHDHLVEKAKPPMPSSAITALKAQILEIKHPDHRIRALITKRAHEFIGTLLISSTATRPIQMPPGLSTLQEELGHICGTLLRLVSHNRSVFGEYYSDIITKCIKARQIENGVIVVDDENKSIEMMTSDESNISGLPSSTTTTTINSPETDTNSEVTTTTSLPAEIPPSEDSPN